jgi:hypothetical protein
MADHPHAFLGNAALLDRVAPNTVGGASVAAENYAKMEYAIHL